MYELPAHVRTLPISSSFASRALGDWGLVDNVTVHCSSFGVGKACVLQDVLLGMSRSPAVLQRGRAWRLLSLQLPGKGPFLLHHHCGPTGRTESICPDPADSSRPPAQAPIYSISRAVGQSLLITQATSSQAVQKAKFTGKNVFRIWGESTLGSGENVSKHG